MNSTSFRLRRLYDPNATASPGISGRELHVFISSTFGDPQQEREHLVRKIFPEIRALCRERASASPGSISDGG